MSKTVETGRRRTQEERSAEAQRKIVLAAAHCIAKNGFKSATMRAIADQAGMTWGAIQHHFGNKQKILEAVIEAGSQEFREFLSEVNLEDHSLEQRVDIFLGHFNEIFDSTLYQANISIQRNTLQPFDKTQIRRLQKVVDEIWASIFQDCDIEKDRSSKVKDYTFMTINGIALQSMSFPGQRKRAKAYFSLLRENMIYMLQTT